MYELVEATPSAYYIDCPAKIGIYLMEDGRACLIDSGNDKDAGKKALKILTQNGWTLSCIVNTHSHSDHIGGNRYLQGQTGCKIYLSEIEGAFTRAPVLEPAFLYGGFPPRELRHKFLMAQGSDVLPLNGEGFPQGLEILPLPGHSFEMIGLRTPDGAVFLADCLASRETLEKYPVSFLYDVQAYLQTLDHVEKMRAEIFIPSHASAMRDIRPLVEYNKEKVWEVIDLLLSLLRSPASLEALIAQVFSRLNLSASWEQYVLTGSTLRSYLAYLKDQGRVEAHFEKNVLLFSAV